MPVHISPRPIRATGRHIAASESIRGAVRSVFATVAVISAAVVYIAGMRVLGALGVFQ